MLVLFFLPSRRTNSLPKGSAPRPLARASLWVPLAAALSCSASDDAPPPAPPPTGGAGDVGVPACAAGDALLPGRVYFTAAQDVRGFAPGCDEGGLHALVRRGDAWGYQVSTDALERPLAGHREGRALAATASGALVEVDLEASPPAFITRDAAGAEASRVAADLPPLRAIDGEADWSFDDVCFSRDGVPTLKQAGGVALELSPPAPGGRAGLLVRTCGYVDLVTFAPDGGPSGRANVVEMPRASTKVIVPLDGFVDASADGASFVAAASRPGRWGGDGAPDRLAIKVVSSSDGATLREGEVAFAGAGTQAAAFRACGARAVVAGERSRQIVAGPNDSDEGDVWAALVDLESMSLVAEATFDVDGDDFAFSVACDAAGDEVYIGGTTGRHFVDTGSWDGGGKALLLRLSGALELRETLTFGTERLAIAHRLLVGGQNLVVGGLWDGLPNNHLPESENWSRGFVAVVPRSGWAGLALSAQPFEALTELGRR